MSAFHIPWYTAHNKQNSKEKLEHTLLIFSAIAGDITRRRRNLVTLLRDGITAPALVAAHCAGNNVICFSTDTSA